MADMTWEDWQAVAACATVIVAALAATFIVWQISVANGQRRLEALSRLWESVGGVQERKARGDVLGKLKNELDELAAQGENTAHRLMQIADAQSEDDGTLWYHKENVEQVLVTYNKVAYMARNGYVDRREIFKLMGSPMAKTWDILKPYVEYRRRREGFPGYIADYEKFMTEYSSSRVSKGLGHWLRQYIRCG